MTNRDDWTWPSRPRTDAEYDSMMTSLDSHLAGCGLLPHQRSLNAKRLISMRLGVSAIIAGPSWLKNHREPFDADDLTEHVSEWYKANYGKRLNQHFLARSVAFDLRGTLWRMRFPIVYGTIQWFIDRNLEREEVQIGRNSPCTGNILKQVEHFTPAYAERLTNEELPQIASVCIRGYSAIEALNNFSGHIYFDQARLDYAHGVDALMVGYASNKARWETAQCAEKIMKGLLGRAGHDFPSKGPHAHDIQHLGGLIASHFGIVVPEATLAAIHCPPKVRYGDIDVSAQDAYLAHWELIKVLPALSKAAT